MKKIALCSNSNYIIEVFQAFLDDDNYSVEFVISGINKNYNRKGVLIETEIEKWCKRNDIKLYSVEKFSHLDLCLFEKLDAVFVFSFGQLISSKYLNIPKHGFVNLHPSNLPQYRGATPIQSCILNDEKYLTLSLMVMNSKFDEGDIIVKKHIEFNSFYNLYAAFDMISLNSKWIVESVLLYMQNKLQTVMQSSILEILPSYVSVIKNEDYYISNESAKDIILKIRALGHVFLKYNDYWLKCYSAKIANEQSKFAIYGIEPIFLQKPGKKIMHVYHFLNGCK